MAFELDPRLEADSVDITQWPLCDVRLMNDVRYTWLVLIPRIAGAVEFIDLSADDRSRLGLEIARASQALKSLPDCEKLNIGMLGNIVSQLHVHIIARHLGDAAWPGPVWGVGTAVAYDDDALAHIVQELRKMFEVNPQG